MTIANFFQFAERLDPSHFFQENIVLAAIPANVIEILFHFAQMTGIGAVSAAGFAGKVVNIGAQIEAGGVGEDFAGESFTNLIEDPGMANGPPADHETSGARLLQDLAGGSRAADVAIGQNGTAEARNGLRDLFIMHHGAIEFLNRPGVNGQSIERMTLKNFQEPIELGGIGKAQAGFDREIETNGGPQGGKDFLNLTGVFQQAAPGVFAADNGSGTTEIEIDYKNGSGRSRDGRWDFRRWNGGYLFRDGNRGERGSTPYSKRQARRRWRGLSKRAHPSRPAWARGPARGDQRAVSQRFSFRRIFNPAINEG
jgi:hypothetical protein